MNITSRVIASMCPNSRLNIAHYHGVLKNWIPLQYEYDCFFMIADYYALIVNHQPKNNIEFYVEQMIIDWLACGIDPAQATIFIQTQVKSYHELAGLLGIITPISWLERASSYKKFIELNPETNSYAFLGYSLSQSADIMLYNARLVPISEEQISSIELAREIARRFNYIYGRESGFEQLAMAAIKKLGSKRSKLYKDLLLDYQQNGNDQAQEKARFLVHDAPNLAMSEKERLLAFLENKSRVILQEPQALINPQAKIPGIDGQKMSSLTFNQINLREDPVVISKKIRTMVTDPARRKRNDRGDPNKCPVWKLHQIYHDSSLCNWVYDGCTNAKIGCLDCKDSLIDSISKEQQLFKQKAMPYLDDPNLIKRILSDGNEKAEIIAQNTIQEIKSIMKINY